MKRGLLALLAAGGLAAATSSPGQTRKATPPAPANPASLTNPVPAPPGGGAASRPNLIVILTDDQGYQDLSCYGSPHLYTPHIDSLAQEGVRFSDFYAAYSVCSASRAGLLTGCYQPRISMPGVLMPRSPTALNPAETTIADLLQSAGYVTACIGKWHLGDHRETIPLSQGFDYFYGLPWSNDMGHGPPIPQRPKKLDRTWEDQKWRKFEMPLYRNLSTVEKKVDQRRLTESYTREAIEWIGSNRDRPFFLYLSHSMPHVPLFVPPEFWRADPAQAYKAVIEHLDDCTGRLLRSLDELGLRENTWIIFTSDNGPWLRMGHHGGSAAPLRDGKRSVYEGAMRVPCLMRWPARLPEGEVCTEVISAIDLLPTIAAALDLPLAPGQPVDGLNVLPTLLDPARPSPRREAGYLFYKSSEPEAIRRGRWKLHLGLKPELYDLEEDIGETRNLAKRHPEVVESLKRAARDYHKALQKEARPPWRNRLLQSKPEAEPTP